MAAQNPLARGSLVAMAAAALFGVTTPLVKHFGVGVGPFATATLLYGGAALGSGLRGTAGAEHPLSREQGPRLALVALFGAVLAPAALAWGLQRSGGLTGSLLLNLEALFTVALAAAFYREPIGRRIVLACGLMLLGGATLALRGGNALAASPWGLVAVCLATLGWALDNTLTRPLSDFEPRAVVFWKATLGGVFSALLALALGDSWPRAVPLVALLLSGAAGYGLSLRLYLRAQRTLGAARTGSLFALAPFLGAVTAFGLGDREGAGWVVLAAALFAVAAYLHVTEHHHHHHRHEPLEHEHPHSHDDGHHTHVHEPAVVGSHTHGHRHDALEHEHPHGSDLHHRHRHD